MHLKWAASRNHSWRPSEKKAWSLRSCDTVLGGGLPGHPTGVAHPSHLLLVVAAAGLADGELAVQTFPLAVHQELEGLQAANAVRDRQRGLRPQQLQLGVLLLDLSLQLAANTGGGEEERIQGTLKRKLGLDRSWCRFIVFIFGLSGPGYSKLGGSQIYYWDNYRVVQSNILSPGIWTVRCIPQKQNSYMQAH